MNHTHSHHHVHLPHIDIFSFFRKNPVMTVALVAAIVTSLIVPPSREYLGYIDFKTLSCLFCVLAVVCALKDINFFYIIAQRIVALFGNMRACTVAIVYITFIGSMLIANDMALLTFLPLGYFLLHTTGKEKYMAFLFVMQNIAANLGGMLTPFGNPQNLYLYSKFNIPATEFVEIMLLPFLVAIGLITVCCIIFVKPEPLSVKEEKTHLPTGRCALYLCLFALSIAIVFKSIPYVAGLIIIPPVLLFFDRHALRQVDYPLLLTFTFFFIFAGNMARIDAVRSILSGLLRLDTLVFSTLSCQVISNVPSAILLSGFTENYRELLLGVNIGGAGTLIASLASLITFREYLKHKRESIKYYLTVFSAFNFGFLAVLLAVMKIFG